MDEWMNMKEAGCQHQPGNADATEEKRKIRTGKKHSQHTQLRCVGHKWDRLQVKRLFKTNLYSSTVYTTTPSPSPSPSASYIHTFNRWPSSGLSEPQARAATQTIGSPYRRPSVRAMGV